ncbi:hypothetical protein [Lactobacillus phage Maenad]|uniref:Uncharacterized protein n=1 Tax=Lactobacillus phage Maenad TaxID=2079431 RepID=A0A2P0ZKV2_9CAUD|nr:hypothetical protein HOS85_gp058 [Lactobacillus phage Maenad]AVH85632.1 hypothetical protein [Lactobacillus phage Maenad]
MYQYKDGPLDITIILGHVTSVFYNKFADTFDVYLTDNDEPNEIPNKFYDDFMNNLNLYIQSQVK